MKKIINGKKYDTDTAKEIGTIDTKWSDALSKTLYQKTTGEFFFFMWNATQEYISPCTEDEAKEFCEDAITVEEYEAIWGEVLE